MCKAEIPHPHPPPNALVFCFNLLDVAGVELPGTQNAKSSSLLINNLKNRINLINMTFRNAV